MALFDKTTSGGVGNLFNAIAGIEDLEAPLLSPSEAEAIRIASFGRVVNPTPSLTGELEAAKTEQQIAEGKRRKKLAAGGRVSTFKTGAAGLIEETAPLARPSLLGA